MLKTVLYYGEGNDCLRPFRQGHDKMTTVFPTAY